MNEHIKELLEEAGWTDPSHFSSFNQIYQWQDFSIQKFVELVVCSCIDTIEESEGDEDYAVFKLKEDFDIQ